MERLRAATYGPISVIALPLERRLGRDTAAPALLFLFAILALAWANLPGDSYTDFWSNELGGDVAGLYLRLTLGHWVNDALMAVFFLVVGMEIKREMLSGALSGRKTAALPVAAALGGMVAPAVIYSLFNATGDGGRGWGIPMATDIAFAVGALALLGSRVPAALKAFLLALAIADDIGGILVIATFYTDDLAYDWLTVTALVLALGVEAMLSKQRSVILYLVIGVALWLAMHASGVHATISGVLLALLMPVRYDERATSAPIDRLEGALQPYSSYLILPLFALANAGVALSGDVLDSAATSRITLGVLVALVAGKPLGIVLFSALALITGLASLPKGVGMGLIAGAGMIAGIGFTVAIFIAELAFEEPTLVDEAKIGNLAASAVAGLLGYTALLIITSLQAKPAPDALERQALFD